MLFGRAIPIVKSPWSFVGSRVPNSIRGGSLDLSDQVGPNFGTSALTSGPRPVLKKRGSSQMSVAG